MAKTMGSAISYSDYVDDGSVSAWDIEDYGAWLKNQSMERLKAEFPELYYGLLEDIAWIDGEWADFEEEQLREADGLN